MNRQLRRTAQALVLAAATAAGSVSAFSVPAQAAAMHSCGQITAADTTAAAQLNQVLTGGLRQAMTGYRVSCARAITTAVRGMGLPDQAAVIAVTTSIVETGLEDNPNVLDHTSVGLFQQQDFWGSTADRLDPAKSTAMFINEMLRRYPNNSWQSLPVGTVCQAVQVSAYPDRYQPQAADAQLIVNALGTGTPSPTPAPASAAVAATSIYNPDTKTAEAFAIGADGVMAHAYSTNGGAWSAWSTLDPSFHFTGSPAVVYNPVNKVTEVFATGQDGVMSHNYLFNGAQWSGWSMLDPGYKFAGSPSAVFNPTTNAIELFGIGTDGVLNHNYNLGAGTWNGWSSLGTYRFTGTPTSVYEPGTNAAEVFAIGVDGLMSHAYSTAGGAWSNWHTLGTWQFKTS